jgi:ABC-type Fe3+ transport system substrate-binding protein
MTAYEATQLVQKRISELGEKDLKMYNKIIDKIKSDIMASSKAIYSTDVYETVSEFVQNKLRSDGYTVSYKQSGPNEQALNVSWPEPSTASDYYNK